MRKVFNVGDVLNVTNGKEIVSVTVTQVSSNKRTIYVESENLGVPEHLQKLFKAHRLIMNKLKYYKNSDTYKVGADNGESYTLLG